MTTTRNVEIYTVERLAALSGRTQTEIFDDMLLGTLAAVIRTTAVDGDDHIKRELSEQGYTEKITTIHPRIIWITKHETAELISQGRVTIRDADYPLFVDCMEDPPVKRYKKERVVFNEPYAAELSNLRLLDGDAAQYIAKHRGVPLAPKDSTHKLPKLDRGGSYVVYRLIDDTQVQLREIFACWKERIERTSEASTTHEIRQVPKGKSTSEYQSKIIEDSATPAKHIYRQPAQEKAILTALKELGYIPTSLPKPPPGKSGPKKEVRKLLKDAPIFQGAKIFDKAWERLRASGEIVD